MVLCLALVSSWIQGPVSWRPTTVKWQQSSQSNRHSTIGTRQTEYHEVLPSSANDEVRCDCTFTDDGNASWYSVCRVSMVEWRLYCENCCHLTVVHLHDTGSSLGPLSTFVVSAWNRTSLRLVFLGQPLFLVHLGPHVRTWSRWFAWHWFL